MAAEIALIHLCRHIGDLVNVAGVVQRHAVYALAACVAGVALDVRSQSIDAIGLLVLLGAAQVLATSLLRLSSARRTIGLAAPAGVLVVADGPAAAEIIRDRAGLTASTIVGVCLVAGAGPATAVAGVPVLGNADDVLALVESLKIHEVVVQLTSPLESPWLNEVQWSLEKLGVKLSLTTPLRSTRAQRVKVAQVGNSLAMAVSPSRPTGLVRQTKAVIEACFAFLVFILTLPVLVVCVVAVKLDSPGPAFFLQTRVRDRNRTFTMIKLRTMSVDAEQLRAALEQANEVGGGLFKMKTDPRVTRVGRVLRKLSLDELPQLLNVMRGEMSLIGPRPALPSEVETYDIRAHRRLGVKPGLTGLWQVSGRSTLSWEESISLDIDYVDNWSAGRDVRIAMETIRAVMRKDGAY